MATQDTKVFHFILTLQENGLSMSSHGTVTVREGETRSSVFKNLFERHKNAPEISMRNPQVVFFSLELDEL